MPFFRPAPPHIVTTWAEHKRTEQALHKLGLILYMWHKRGFSPYVSYMEALPV